MGGQGDADADVAPLAQYGGDAAGRGRRRPRRGGRPGAQARVAAGGPRRAGRPAVLGVEAADMSVLSHSLTHTHTHSLAGGY